MADAATVADRFGLDCELVDELLLDYEAYGWITHVVFADVDGWALTAAGRAENERRLAAELDRSGTRSEVVAAHEVFLALNSRFLSTITRWQIRPKPTDPLAANDHIDPDWDQRVLDDLHDLGRELQPVCETLTIALPRFAGYPERYAAALDRADRGEQAWSPSRRSTPATQSGWNCTRTYWPRSAWNAAPSHRPVSAPKGPARYRLSKRQRAPGLRGYQQGLPRGQS